MKTLYLWVNPEGWKSFQYKNIEELKDELTSRCISIGHRASIGDRASIGRGAFIGLGASIGRGASIGDEASIGRGASIGLGASIGRGASIGDEASIGHRASIGLGASIGRGASIKNTLFITASRHIVAYWGEDRIQIGCKQFSISEWGKMYKSVGADQEYTEEEMNEYKGYIDMISNLHKMWSIVK